MTDLNSIIVRSCSDNFYAFKTAHAMQSMPHVDVVSVVCRPVEKLSPLDSGERWYVYAKFASDMVTPDQIDEEISKVYGEQP